jgi:hypothetical protein
MRFALAATLMSVVVVAAGCPGRLAFCNESTECELGEVCVLGSCVNEPDAVDDAGVEPPPDGGVVVPCAVPLEGGAFRVCGTAGVAAGTSTSTSGALRARAIASSPVGRTPMAGGSFVVR